MVHFFLCPEIFHGRHKDGKQQQKHKTHRGNKNEIKSKLAQVQKLGNKK